MSEHDFVDYYSLLNLPEESTVDSLIGSLQIAYRGNLSSMASLDPAQREQSQAIARVIGEARFHLTHPGRKAEYDDRRSAYLAMVQEGVFAPSNQEVGAPESWTQKAYDLYNQGALPAAKRAADSAVRKDPTDGHAWLISGYVEVEYQEYEKAVEAFRCGLAIVDSTHAKTALVIALQRLNRPDEALPLVREILAEDPTNSQIRSEYVILLTLTGHVNEAIRWATEILTENPNDTAARNDLAKAYTQACETVMTQTESGFLITSEEQMNTIKDLAPRGMALGQTIDSAYWKKLFNYNEQASKANKRVNKEVFDADSMTGAGLSAITGWMRRWEANKQDCLRNGDVVRWGM
jgi:tetratricopeptide (TPR) repeat protein